MDIHKNTPAQPRTSSRNEPPYSPGGDGGRVRLGNHADFRLRNLDKGIALNLPPVICSSCC